MNSAIENYRLAVAIRSSLVRLSFSSGGSSYLSERILEATADVDRALEELGEEALMAEMKIVIPESSPLFPKVLELIEVKPEEPPLKKMGLNHFSRPCADCGKDWSQHYFHSNEYRCPR